MLNPTPFPSWEINSQKKYQKIYIDLTSYTQVFSSFSNQNPTNLISEKSFPPLD